MKEKEKIDNLIKIINDHNYRYYVLNDPIISDGEYDKSFKTGINYRPNSQWKIELDFFSNNEINIRKEL